MKVTKEDIARMRELKANGKSYEQIRRIMGYSISTIRRWVSDEFREKVKRLNLARYHRTKNDPVVKAAYKAARKKYYDTHGY